MDNQFPPLGDAGRYRVREDGPMETTFLDPIRNKWTAHAFLACGLMLNSLLHLYRFWQVEWTHVTGLTGHAQSIKWSFVLTLWVLVPLCLTKLVDHRRNGDRSSL